MSFWAGALLSGLGAGAQAYGRSEMVRREQERRDAATLAAIEARQSRASGGGSGGSRGSSGSGAAAAPLDRATLDRNVAAVLGLNEGDIERIQSGSFWDRTRQAGGGMGTDEYGNELAESAPTTINDGRAEGWEQLQAKKLQEIRQLREAFAFGEDYEKVAKGMGERQTQGMLERYEDGNDRSGRAAMISQGKGIFEGNSDVTRDVVGGETKTTPVGDAEVAKKRAEAGKAVDQGRAAMTKANQPPAPRGGGGGGKSTEPKPTSGIDLSRITSAAKSDLAIALGVPSSRVEEEAARLQRSGKLTPDQQQKLAAYQSALARQQAIGSGSKPGAAPARPGIKVISVTPIQR